jgi:dienelactone hydrolase
LAAVPFPAPDGPSMAIVIGGIRLIICCPEGDVHILAATGRFLCQATCLALVTTALVSLIPLFDMVRGAALVIRAADLRGPGVDQLTSVTGNAFHVEHMQVPSRYGNLRARLYRPDSARRRTVILTAGVHAQGIDEPRLVKLAGDLASVGIPTLTPELPDLLEYRITPRLPDMLEDVIVWTSNQPAFTSDGRVGLVGISFSGGLSVVAAGRPAARDRVAYVVAFGGHGNLGRTLRYLCTGIQPDGQLRPPHDYGVVIILLNGLQYVVQPEQVEPLQRGILTFLHASHVDMVDHAQARLVFDEAIAYEQTLPEPARTLLHYVNTRDVKHLGPLLLPHVDRVTTDPSLSAERSPAPTAPVYLLHGTDDNVIPAVESGLLAESLKARGTDVTLLLSPLITHAELDRETDRRDVWNLLRFWGSVLAHG